MDRNMTRGNPAKQIILFSLPMLAGNLFQQFYNIVDTVVVGRYVGHEALAAVGASFAIVTFISSVIIGLCMGASVLFSQLYGAKDTKRLSPAVSTAFLFVMAVGAVLSVVTFALARPIVVLYQMPAETVEMAVQYLRYIFGGLVFTALYHFCAFLLRAFGDSRTPLYFLVFSCLVNIVLDLVFVLVLHMEVEGVALATFIAQAASGILCFGYTLRKAGAYGLQIFPVVFDRAQFRQIFRFSILTSVQQSMMNFGILLVQGLVNTFGAITIAAFSAGVKIDAFAYLPLQDYGNAFSTFAAQNKGAGEDERIRQGLRFSAWAIAVFSAVVTVLVFLFAPAIISLIVGGGQPEGVVRLGAQYLRAEGLFYVLIGYLFLFYGVFRGLGKPSISVVLTVVSLGSRVVLAYVLAATPLGFSAIPLAIVLGWLLADVLGLVLYHKTKAALLPGPPAVKIK